MQANVMQKSQLKAKLPVIKPGDTVRVHQVIREGNKTRTQVFEGLVIRYRKPNEGNAYLTVRKIASGVGVEKSWFVHSPNVEKIEVMRRAKVRRAFLSYMRGLRGKKARLVEQDFDKTVANDADHRTTDAIAALEAETQAAEAEAAATDAGAIESTEDVAKDEAKTVDADDVKSDGDDEQELAAAETAEGLDKAAAEDDKAQSK